jgi:hypothetical protein
MTARPYGKRSQLADKKVTPNRRRPALTVVTEERLHQVETERHRRVRRQAAAYIVALAGFVVLLAWVVAKFVR